MNAPLLLLTIFMASLGYQVGCAPVEFTKDTYCGADCVFVNGLREYKYEIIPNEGKVDILFVSDNSGSMSFEQKQMANRFATFIEELDRRKVDYRIGITTTDISSPTNVARTINQFGALQDGRLINLGNNRYYLSKENFADTASRVAAFNAAIQRSETRHCELFLNSQGGVPTTASYNLNCPSGDERGLYAASLTIERNDQSFLRAGAHLAVVVLSDEDIRSQAYASSAQFALEDKDKISYMQQLIANKYSGKLLKVHAIVIKPGDFNCLDTQNNQTNRVRGSEGHLYAQAAQQTGGLVGDICANDYGSQLYDIASNIGESIYQRTLHCANPKAINATTPIVSFLPVASSNTFELLGQTLTFNPHLLPGTKAYLQYACPE